MVKAHFYISGIIKLSVIFCISFTIVSCRNHFPTTHSLGIADDGLNKQNHINAVDDISQFLISAAEINREEIKMGQLAQHKGNNKFIKEFCKEMETQHSMMFKELNQLAEKREIYLHTQFSYYAQDTYQLLNNTMPQDFDKAYCDWIIRSQQESIALFDEASNDTTDLEINAWAKGVLPILRKQLIYALACQKKFEKV